MPKSKGRSKKATGKRPGRKGTFQGSRLEFLTSQVEAYSAAANKGSFWDTFFPAWYARFPWWLADNVEPKPEDMVFAETETPEVLERKKAVLDANRKVRSAISFAPVRDPNLQSKYSDSLIGFTTSAPKKTAPR